MNVYDKEHPLHDLDGWIVFYGQQAQRLENDESMREVYQASCETAALLLELKPFREARDLIEGMGKAQKQLSGIRSHRESAW